MFSGSARIKSTENVGAAPNDFLEMRGLPAAQLEDELVE
jgi:hypothetical protein